VVEHRNRLPRDTKNHLMGHSPEQPALADPVLSRGIGLDRQRSLPTSNILWFCSL